MGLWLAASPAQLRKAQGHYMRPLRRIAGHDSPPAEGQRWPTTVETLSATGQAPVQAHIAAARLRQPPASRCEAPRPSADLLSPGLVQDGGVHLSGT